MKTLGEASTECETLAEIAIKSNVEWVNKKILYESSAEAVVSPIHRGVESACFNLEVNDSQFFMKVRQPDMKVFFDDKRVIANNKSASDCSISPRVIFDDPESGSIVFEHIGQEWHWGCVDELSRPTILENTINAKKFLHNEASFVGTKSVFDVIEDYWDIIIKKRIKVPDGTQEILKETRKFSRAIAAAGVDTLPCHGDGIASNVMIGPDDQVRLVDYDMSSNMDPYFDLGSLILEAFQFPSGAYQVLEIYDGTFIEVNYNRCRLYGIADDLMWSLWGLICSKISSRKEIEFIKYSEWRLLRAKWNLSDPDYGRWVSHL